MSSVACHDSATEPEQAGLSASTDTVAALAAAVASNSWLTKANMPSDRIRTTTASVADPQGRTTLYVIGGRNPSSTAGFCSAGLSKVQAYNSGANTWSTKAQYPIVVQSTNGAGVIGGKIYVTGGCTGSNRYTEQTWMYDPSANTWTAKAPMPVATWAGNTGVIQNKLYVLSSCEGQEDCGAATNLFFGSYDPQTNTWTSLPLPPSNTAHHFGASAVIGGKFYVVGGGFTDRVEVYDPATNGWSTRAPWPTPRLEVASTAVGGKLYAIGGVRPSDLASVTTTSVYDPTTDTWKNLARAPRGGRGLAAARVVVSGQPRIELIGGARPGNNLQYVP
jgi:N-acetylneuraminic acid mutarotase